MVDRHVRALAGPKVHGASFVERAETDVVLVIERQVRVVDGPTFERARV